ncbi:MAG TPA: GntR family transcriptional regulator [Rhodocyclaceae bacterium]|nr:GntR family transcriptional regulator [Rhodocyclaceae bacterium]
MPQPVSPQHFHLDPQQPEPIFRQLMAQVRRLIAAGQLKPGDELPSVRAVAAAHAINPMTISKAYSLLESEGVLLRNRGAAMTVAEAAVTTTLGQEAAGIDARLTLLTPALERVLAEATQLGLDNTQVIEALTRLINKTASGKESEA